ncbi:MAG TPA: MarR family winged helix-turn-helix transcriptional regulator [Steroidobacteraceae bacterium]|jgi:DNA-binding MarR family transcriptional regulator|nr:MarR family winged helix-turn-helix transcriptional regulator [Steroidobacteraceae bacterium]
MSATPKRQSPQATPSHELAPHDYEVLAEFRYLLMRFAAFSEQAAHAAGVAPRQHQALLAIKGYPGGAEVAIGDLAGRLGIRHHSTVGLVDRLVGRGYLVRGEDPHDRRRSLLSLTAAGEQALAGLSAAHRRELRRVAPLLKSLLGRLGPQEHHDRI